MTVLRGLLLGGACGVGILSYSAIADIGNAASAVKPGSSNLQLVRIADNSSTPAWAAPAKMNPDYQSDQKAESPAPAPAASAAASADKATTSYYGNETPAQNPAWAAPAKMNPDYQGNEAAAAPKAAESAQQPSTSADKATTSYYGNETPAQNPAWAAPAKMNPDYSNAASPAAQPSTTPTEPAAAPVRNAAVEACREALTAEVPSVKLHFAESSYDIPAGSRGALKKIAKIVENCGQVVVEVSAFTDNTGKAESNMKLSDLRAKAVVRFLTSAGVDASKLKAVGNGESRPITTNSTAEGRRRNRRVEFVVLSQ